MEGFKEGDGGKTLRENEGEEGLLLIDVGVLFGACRVTEG